MAEESFGLQLRAFIERISAGAVKITPNKQLKPDRRRNISSGVDALPSSGSRALEVRASCNLGPNPFGDYRSTSPAVWLWLMSSSCQCRARGLVHRHRQSPMCRFSSRYFQITLDGHCCSYDYHRVVLSHDRHFSHERQFSTVLVQGCTSAQRD